MKASFHSTNFKTIEFTPVYQKTLNYHRSLYAHVGPHFGASGSEQGKAQAAKCLTTFLAHLFVLMSGSMVPG
jgi:hypothetical protein